MTKKEDLDLVEAQVIDGFREAVPYLLAGLKGLTNGNEIISVTLQQTDFSGFRVILRGVQRDPSGDKLRVVGFTSGANPTGCFLLAEKAYREDSLRWHVDKFAESTMPGSSSKNGKLVINE